MMIAVNELEKTPSVSKKDFLKLLLVLAPFAPHLCEELWALSGEKGSVHVALWPAYDEKKLIDDEVTIAISVNGKVRAEITIPLGTSQEEIEQLAKKEEKVQTHLSGKEIMRVIYVPNKLLNLVIR